MIHALKQLYDMRGMTVSESVGARISYSCSSVMCCFLFYTGCLGRCFLACIAVGKGSYNCISATRSCVLFLGVSGVVPFSPKRTRVGNKIIY